VPGAVKKSLKV